GPTLVGTDATGTAALGNGQVGVLLLAGATGNTVMGNVVSGNVTGVRLQDAGTAFNTVEGNFIGTDATGLLPLGNSAQGVLVLGGASQNAIGGQDQGNLISANGGGVAIEDPGTIDNTVQGNRIGPDAGGTAALPGQA